MDLNINFKSKKVLVVSLAVLFLIAAVQVHAGTGGDEFKDLYDQLMGWVQGTLGKVVAVSMILVGIIAGVARQSIMAFAVGIAAGLGLYYAPTVIDKTLSAVPLESDPQLLYRALSQLCTGRTHQKTLDNT
jgi:conjugal transfer pilus assembly protein TraA